MATLRKRLQSNHSGMSFLFKKSISLAFGCLALLSPMVIAAAEAGYTTHTVVPGDTLYELARQYLGTTTAWPEIQRHNNVRNPLRLKPGTDLLIPLPSPSVTVIYAEGDVQLLTNETGPQVLEIGEKLGEGARVSVGRNSYLSLQFADGSIVRVLSDSIVRLAQVREQAKPASRRLELEQGTMDVSVTPQSPVPSKRSRQNTFEVITPGAVAAVRGTRFDVVVGDDQKTSSGVTEGVVAVSSNNANGRKKNPSVAVNAGYGIPVEADGSLGEMRALLPPAELNQLQSTQSADFVSVEWPELTHAQGYQVKLARNNDPDHVLRNVETSTPQARFGNLANGVYTLSVRGIDPDNILGLEAHRPVTVRTSPAYPLYIQPAQDQRVSGAVDFVCTPVTGAAEYHLQVSTDAGFGSTVIDADGLADCGYSTDLPPGQYYWRVATKATDAEGNLSEGPYSFPAAFEVDATGEKPEVEQHPTSFWVGEPGLSYTAQISTDEDFSNIVRELEVSGNSISTDDLAPGSYFIRLQARDETGLAGNVTQPRQFEIQPGNEGGGVDRTWFDKAK